MADFPTDLTNAIDGSTDVLAKHINNLEAKVGVDSSAVTTSHDYKLSGVTGTDKSVSKTGTETLTNKTLTTPVINGAVTGTMTPPLTFYSTNFNPPEGFLINGKIVPSVASNNLTVAIKGMNGNDPSATNPVYVRIGSTIRSITAACDMTENAGGNTYNAGSAELATKEIDYFVYLCYSSVRSEVVLGFARIPYATVANNFSSTSTSETYSYLGDTGYCGASDTVVVIGRFAATLSAGAGYTWTVPTFTATNLIQRPVYETRLLYYAPTFTGFSANPTTTATYRVVDRMCFLNHSTQTGGTSNATTYTITLPITPFSLSGTIAWRCPAFCFDNGASITAWGSTKILDNTTTASIFTDAISAAWTNSGTKWADFSGWYEV